MFPSDIALLRPFLVTVGLALSSALMLVAGKQNGVTAFVPGWEGKVPYFSLWEPVLPWLGITAAFAAYLAGAVAVRLSRRAVVGLVAVVLTGVCGVAALQQAVEARDRDNAYEYDTCVQVDAGKYVCEGGWRQGIGTGHSQSEMQALLYSGPPPYPYHPGWGTALLVIGLAIFSVVPRRGWRAFKRKDPSRAQGVGDSDRTQAP